VKRVAFVIAWSVALLCGAYYLRAHPSLPGILGVLAASEPAHIVAHSLLYGTLAAGCYAVAPRPVWAAPLVTLAVAVLQEGAQTVAFGKPMGGPEAFDLLVDTLAMTFVLTWLHRRDRHVLAARARP
jgi:hypothetical protein